VQAEPSATTPPRIRGRAVVLGTVLVLLAGSGVALDRVMGARATGPGRAETGPTGSWFCPHGGADGWRGWVVMTNPGTEPVSVRITSFGEAGIRRVAALSVAPNRQVYRRVYTGDPAASTQIEYFGGWVGAAAVLRSKGSDGPAAAERCVGAPLRAQLLPDEQTGPGQTSFMVVMNPFAADAAFDVVIRTEKREVRPKRFSPFVLEGHRSVALRVNDHLLQAPGEHTVAAQIESRIGRVIAGGLGLSEGGIRAEAGIWPFRPRAIIPAGGHVGPAQLLLVNPLPSPADVLIVSEGRASQQVIAGPAGISIPPGGVRTVEVPETDAGVVVSATEDRHVAAALRLTGSGGDGATISGAVPAGSWLVMPTLPPAGGEALLIMQNPGRSLVRVTVRLIGSRGLVIARELESFVVEAGRIIHVPLRPAVGSRPVSVLVTAAEGTIVAASSSYTRGGSGYAATLGLPMQDME
jgi:hypothetical protein